MKRTVRLTRSTDIKRVRRLGKSYAHPLVVLIALSSEQPEMGESRSRFGVIAGRSVGGAVQRNRCKRLIRESLRAMLPNLAPGWDVVVLARQASGAASFAEIRSALHALARRAGLLLEEEHV